ncbi:MAG TPA: pallilysin-related adhesin [Spirochaetia bacterium]|nr:pallilysin-related adhesin [Spirochaetia bacterium]
MNSRRIPFVVTIVISVLAVSMLVSCGAGGKAGTAHSGVFIVPKPAEGMVFGSSITAADARSQPPEEIPAVKVPLPSDIMVQQVIDTNIDLDNMDEQLVVFKKREATKVTDVSIRGVGAQATSEVAAGQTVNGSKSSLAQGAGAASTRSTAVSTDSLPSVPGETVQDLEARTANDAIWIMLVDFDTVRNAYVVSWEAPTRATNIRTFKVTTVDLLGDHNIEIVCQGTNTKGEQTLDVFKRGPTSAGINQRFSDIISLVSDGSIDIQELQRTDAYHSGQSSGESFPIVALTRDASSSNPLDMIRTTYVYSSRDGKYVKGYTEQVPGSRIEEAQLSNLYNGNAANIEDFLNGPWYRVNDSAQSDTNPAAAPSTEIMQFDKRARTITFAQGEIEQSFLVEESYKTAYQRGIQLKIQNLAIPTLRHFAAISVSTMDTIDVAIQGDTTWDGTYRKLTGGLHQVLSGELKRGVTLSNFKLSGLYRNDSGTEIFFSPPRFTLRENGVEHAGEFIIYQFGQKVLELRVLSALGRVEQRRLYLMKYSEQVSKTQTVRVLNLTPATVSVHGFEPLNNEVQRYEQIEQKGQNSTSNGG